MFSLSLPSIERTCCAAKDDFLAGVEWGYKVTIASVREWMYDNARNYVDGVLWYDYMMRDLETFMSKLWGK